MIRAAVAGARHIVLRVPAGRDVIAPGARALAAAAAVGHLHHVVAQHIAAAVQEIVVVFLEPVDDAVVHLFRAVRVVDLLEVLVAVPDAADERRRAAHVPKVVDILRRTGLADLVEVAAVNLIRRGVGAARALDRQVQELVHNRRVVERHRLLGLALLVIVDHVAVVILDAVDRVRLVILAAVAEHLIGRGHFADADALVEAAERNAAEVVGVILRERRDMQLLGQKLEADHRRHLVDELHHRRVQRFRQRAVHIRVAHVAGREIARAGRAVGEIVRQRLVLDDGAVGDEIVLERRRVNADRLDRGAGRVGRRGDVVPAAVSVFFDIVALCVHLVGVHGQNTPVILHQAGAGPDVVVVCKAPPVISQQLLEALLQRHILRRVDLQAAVVDHIDRVVLVHVRVFHQDVDRVLKDLLVVPVPDVVLDRRIPVVLAVRIIVRVSVKIDAAELQVVGFLEGRIAFCLRDHPLIVHLLDNRVAALLVLLRVVKDAELRGVLGRRRDRRAFRDAALSDVLAEVAPRRRLHAVVAVAVVDEVQVCFEDLILRVFLFEVQRHEDLLDLSRDADLIFTRQVLDELLGNRGAAGAVRACHKAVHRAERAVPVHAVVLVEALVLNGDHRILHNLRDLVEIDARADLRAVVAHVLGPLRRVHAVDVQGIRHIGVARFVELERREARREFRIVVAPNNRKNAEADEAAGDDADEKDSL